MKKRIDRIVEIKQELDVLFDEKELPHSFMIAQYALKQLIYELQKEQKKQL